MLECNTNFHHSIQIVFDEKNWIISALKNHADMKHHVILFDVEIHRSALFHSDTLQEYAYVANEMSVFEFLE